MRGNNNTSVLKNMNKTQLFWTLLVGLIMASGFNCQSPKPNKKLVDAINQFSVDLFKKITETNKNNIICSGYSAHAVLNLLLAGARGSTEQEIFNTLGYKDFSVTEAELPSSYRQLLELQNDNNENYELDVANSAWIQSGFTINKNFSTYVQDNFRAEQRQADFSNALATNQINNWVSEKTKTRIPKLYDEPLDPSTVLVLVNAIFFKGKWLTQFKESQSKKEEFFSGSGSKQVLMMKQTISARYTDTKELDAQVLALPYKGSDVSMVFILPHDINGLESLERKLSVEKISNVLGGLSREEVHVTIPKFSVTSTIPLTSLLKSLGIVKAFSPGANLTGISNHSNLYVSDAIQKADIEVTEEGTVAAAATGISISTYSAFTFKREPVTFTANHPFFYMIRQESTGIILFCGRVVKL